MAEDNQRPAGPRVIPSLPDVMNIGGGLGQNVAAWSRPDLLVSAPGGVTMLTPAHTVMSAGATASLAAQQDINLNSARHIAMAVANGFSIFTYGKASDPNKPNQETGLQFHAASGNVSVQAQKNTLELTADKAINVASTTDAITIGSPKHVLLAAGGSSIRITSGGITLTTSGPASFKAAMKELTSGASASVPGIEFAEVALRMPKAPLEVSMLDADGGTPNGEALTLLAADGVEHKLSIAGAPAIVNDFKPGLAKATQTKRRD